MDILIIIGAIQAVFFAIIIFSKKRKSVSDKILAVWLSFFAVHLAFVYYSYTAGTVFYIQYGYFPTGVLVLYYSIMYVYALSLISKENVFKVKWLIHLVPTIIVYVSIIPFAMLPYEEKAKFVTNITSNIYQYLVLGFILLFVAFYLVAILRLLKKHKITIRKMFSYEENINLNWLRILAVLLLMLFVIISGLVAFVYYIDLTSSVLLVEDQVNLDMQGQTAFVVFVFLLGFFGIKQQMIYAPSKRTDKVLLPENNIQIDEGRYQKSGLKREDSQNHLKELLQYMMDEKPYLDGKLSLKQVAEKLEISSNYLSQVINENLNKNFFDFVNGYRVDLIKEKMSNAANGNITILGLAYDCGFNSKSSFNSIFKKYTGLTPSQYLKSI